MLHAEHDNSLGIACVKLQLYKEGLYRAEVFRHHWCLFLKLGHAFYILYFYFTELSLVGTETTCSWTDTLNVWFMHCQNIGYVDYVYPWERISLYKLAMWP